MKPMSDAIASSHRYPRLWNLIPLLCKASQSLIDRASDEILKRVITGEFPPGMQLKCTELAKLLGMSRTPVAGALSQLVTDGVLVKKFHHAAAVGDNASDWLLQVHQLRQILEPEAAALACGKLPADLQTDLRILIDDARPHSRDNWRSNAILLDYATHLSVAQFCGNEPLATSIRKCWSYKRLSYELSDACGPTLESEYAEHVAIYQATVEGDATQVRRLMTHHLQLAADNRTSRSVV